MAGTTGPARGAVRPQRGLNDITTYVPGKPVADVEREFGITDIIKLASNENPMGPSPKALEAMQTALASLNSYPDGDWFVLRRALSAALDVSPEQVFLGNGADGVIMQTCMAYVDQDDEVIVSRTSFPVYDVYVQAMRGRLVKTPLTDDYRIDLGAMLDAITPQTKLVFIANPNNPTGTIVTASEVERFVRALPDHVLAVLDEAYFDFVDSSEYPDTLRYVREGLGNVMVMRTFSKVYGLAGIRLGYGVAAPELLAPLHKIREPFAVNLAAQAAGVAALADDDYLRRSVGANASGREYLYRELARLGLFYLKSHANFVLVRFGNDAGTVIHDLLAAGIIVRPCGGYELPEFARITVGSAEQNTRLIETLGAILSPAAR